MNSWKDIERDLLNGILDDIMEEFNFDEVKIIMDALDWTWGNSDKVPSLEEIKDAAANLLWKCVTDDGNNVIASGGFEVEKDFSDVEDPYVTLKFVVTEWTSNRETAENQAYGLE